MPPSDDSLLPLVARIVSAHVEHNATPSTALPGLIREVYQALAGLREDRNPTPPGPTVFADRLICLDCALSVKMLKRHLQTAHDLTPAEYRARWRLAADYPMVAREYAALRSRLARQSGLGRRGGESRPDRPGPRRSDAPHSES